MRERGIVRAPSLNHPISDMPGSVGRGARESACTNSGSVYVSRLIVDVNLICDPPNPEGPNDFYSEVPAPKAGLRRGDMVLLAECYDWQTNTLRGRQALYNVTADLSQERDLALTLPAVVHELAQRMMQYLTPTNKSL